MPNNDYAALVGLQNLHGYKILEALWMHQVSEVEKARDGAAKRGTESAWRYHAGKEAGFKLCMTALQRAIAQMEKEDENLQGDDRINKLLEEIKNK
jgi:hypothetical protein